VNPDEKYLQRCLQLAELGKGNVAPNPMVGCVIVHEDRIIGEGYHQEYGKAHAEVNAIRSVQYPELLTDCTLYVSLEPCAHYGKTPPCADLIVTKKIPRVVIGCTDTFSLVAGKGIEKLKAAGIQVTVGILEKESRELNRAFFTFHEKKRPYVVLKWAQSADGFADIDRSQNEKGIAWISQPETQTLVHQWRAEHAAILVGWKTIATDNPELTVREVQGRNPLRVIIDPGLRLDYTAFKVGDGKNPTLVLTAKNANGNPMLRFVTPTDFTPRSILETLWKENIQSVFVEGGCTTHSHFITDGLWDEARIITGTSRLQRGMKAPTIKGDIVRQFEYGQDQVIILTR
jgi:diaminohydroxyphosphoribosylaminopyrimidine deaminase / 5-amino-6-(5-phosphoribosylamino)uracil reductase